MTRTLRQRQDYDKDYKKMVRLWQGLYEYDKNMTRIWQGLYEYDKDFKKKTRLW